MFICKCETVTLLDGLTRKCFCRTKLILIFFLSVEYHIVCVIDNRCPCSEQLETILVTLFSGVNDPQLPLVNQLVNKSSKLIVERSLSDLK